MLSFSTSTRTGQGLGLREVEKHHTIENARLPIIQSQSALLAGSNGKAYLRHRAAAEETVQYRMVGTPNGSAGVNGVE
jgi:hypothetical protein